MYAGDNQSRLPYCHNDNFISAAFGGNYWDPDSPKFTPNFYDQLKPYLRTDAVWNCPALKQPLKEDYNPNVPAPLIAFMGNIYAISDHTPSIQLQTFRKPALARLFADQGVSGQSVWTWKTLRPDHRGNPLKLHWPVPMHYPGSSKAGINAVHSDTHVDFFGGIDYERGPGDYRVGRGTGFRWWREGIDPRL